MESGKFAKEERPKSWYYVISTLALLVTSLGLTFYPFHWSLQLGFSILSGLLLVRFFVIYHDYEHRAILNGSKLADLLFSAFGVFILAPASIWKKTHNHHHKHNCKLSNHGIGDFPILAKEDFNKLSKKDKRIYLTIRHPLTIGLGYLSVFMFDFNIKTFMQCPKDHLDSLVALLIHFSLIAVLVFTLGIWGLFVSLILPFTIACGMGAYLFYAQHNFPSAVLKTNREWDYFDAALKSSSYLKTNRIMQWFTANIGFHHVHHINHFIPFYKLPQAMKEIKALQNPQTTNLSPAEIIRCLRLKVWDPDLGRLTGV